jgi:hypothetical protein
MGICVSTVVGTDRSAQQVPLNNPEMEEPPEEIINRKNEVVLQQPSRTKNFDADDNPLPAAVGRGIGRPDVTVIVCVICQFF